MLQNIISINARTSSCRKDFLFISHVSWIYAVSSLAAQSWLRSSFCSFRFDSLSPQLAPCRAPAPCGAGSCCPTCPGPGSCSIIHLQEGPLQQKLLPCPSLGSVVCVPVGLKRPKRTWGEKICGWSQQVIERVSPKYPQLVLPWLKTYSSPGTVSSAKHCRKGPEESFQPVLCFIFDSFHFPFSSEGTQLEQE